MSDTELDVSSLGSGDDGVLVFPPESESAGEEEEEEWEDAEEDAEGGEDAERASAQPSGLPFLVVPEAEDDRSVTF